MKVAFDGTVLHGPKSGVGYYCEELLKAMLASNHDDQFVVFSHQRLGLDLPSFNGNLKFADSVRFPVRAFYLHLMLPKVLDAIGPDICHYTNFLAPVSEERPYVVTIHDMGVEVLRNAHPLAKRTYTRRLIPYVARKARLVITNSEYSKWEIVRHLGIPEDHIRVTPLAASPEFTPIIVHPASPYFLYVGNLEPRKNLERLIEAFARIPGKEHQLLVAGNRWYHGGAAEQKARSLGLNGRVKFLGYVPRAELPGLFSGATALVYPSLLEGFGLPIVEAMACGTPVITSNNSSMREVAGEAAVLVDPRNVREITDAMARVAEDRNLRKELSAKGIKRAAEFSWTNTAELTLQAYREALGPPHSPPRRGGVDAPKARTGWREARARQGEAPIEDRRNDSTELTTPALRASPPLRGGEYFAIRAAIHKTIEYARLFDYPLASWEIRERLFDIEIDEVRFQRIYESLGLKPDEHLQALRREREKISDIAIREVQHHLQTLASMPFVRLIAFSGSTAHRNMTSLEDVDLFMIVEDGKVWAVFLGAIVWAKIKGLRKRLCMNYLISDQALPVLETDLFTAQQVASLKPIYGKLVYDRFLAANPFVQGRFPNFESRRHREMYPEIEAGWRKPTFERVLRLGPAQIFERLARFFLKRYLMSKRTPESELQLDTRRLKLHLHSNKPAILEKF